MDERDVQFSKTRFPINVRLLGNLTSVSLEQPLNALASIVVKQSYIFTEKRFVQDPNAESDINVKFEGKSREVIEVQL